MTIVNISLDEMLKKIDFTKIFLNEEIIPSSFPLCPSKEEWVAPYYFRNIPKTREDIPENSCLWIQFMSAKCEEVITNIQHNVRIKRGNWGYPSQRLLGLALENAFNHGNKNNPELPVFLTAYEGTEGIVARVKDSGEGFNFKRKIEIVRELITQTPHFGLDFVDYADIRYGNRYFKRRGQGLVAYETLSDKVSFEGKGNIVNIMFHNSTKP